MHSRNRCHAIPKNALSAILSHSWTTNFTFPLDFTNSVCQECEKLVSRHLNLTHSMLHGSCRSEEPCTLFTYFYAVQHTINQVWRQGAANGIKKSSTKWRKVQHACAWQFVFQVRLNKNLQLKISRSRSRCHTHTNECAYLQLEGGEICQPRKERDGGPSIDNLHNKICTINCISEFALLVAVLHVCSTLYSVQNFICTTSSLHVIVHR